MVWRVGWVDWWLRKLVCVCLEMKLLKVEGEADLYRPGEVEATGRDHKPQPGPSP